MFVAFKYILTQLAALENNGPCNYLENTMEHVDDRVFLKRFFESRAMAEMQK